MFRKLTLAAALSIAAVPAAGLAQTTGSTPSIPSLVNVDLRNVLNNLAVQLHVDRANIPVNAQIPVQLAANVCGVSVNVLSVSTGGQANCTAKTAPQQLAQTVQQQMAAGGSVGGGAQSTSAGSGVGAATGGASNTSANSGGGNTSAGAPATAPATGATASAPSATSAGAPASSTTTGPSPSGQVNTPPPATAGTAAATAAGATRTTPGMPSGAPAAGTPAPTAATGQAAPTATRAENPESAAAYAPGHTGRRHAKHRRSHRSEAPGQVKKDSDHDRD